MASGVFKNILRIAVIEKVSYAAQTVTIKMLDRVETKRFVCPLPQPAALNSSGIFVSPSIGTTVVVGFGYNEAPFIVATLPRSSYAEDLTLAQNTTDFFSTDASYPNLRPGEIALQGKLGSQLLLNDRGDVDLQYGDSCFKFDRGDVASHKTGSEYVNTEAYRKVSGAVRRDLRKTVRQIEEVFDKLFDPSYDRFLSNIGKNPELSVATITSGSGETEIIRNPGLVENRELTYEFVRSDQVGTFKQENDRLTPAAEFNLDQPNRRDLVRADVLSLNPTVPNNLSEEIKGTLVDRYGNILDLNRNIINFTEIDAKGGLERLQKEDVLLRRSIKYHFEINSRKPPTQEVRYDILDARDDVVPIKNGYLHSRWQVDVDGEGLTKINIPASTNTGNIPLLTRYVNTAMREERNDWSFRDENAVDVLHLAYGELSDEGGIDIDSPGYVPQNVAAEGEPGAGQEIKYRTAWHDLPKTAEELFGPVLGGQPDPGGLRATTDVLVNTPDGLGNAGGRSVHTNLDGSLELNVGRDTADAKSFVLDTAGSVIYRIGKDYNENSVITQVDGHVKVQVGGDTIEADSQVTNPSVKFFIDSDSGFHQIEINENGVFIKSAAGKNLVLESGNNLVLKAAGQALFHGELISLYGTAGEDGNDIAGERLVSRSGRVIQ